MPYSLLSCSVIFLITLIVVGSIVKGFTNPIVHTTGKGNCWMLQHMDITKHCNTETAPPYIEY